MSPKVVALVAHDAKKDAMVDFCVRHRPLLSVLSLVATGTTGGRIADATGLLVERVLSGPLGGDAQVRGGARALTRTHTPLPAVRTGDSLACPMSLRPAFIRRRSFPRLLVSQIATLVATGKCHALIFIIDPLSAHPHEPDIHGLLRVCNVHNIPVATNIAAAEILVAALAIAPLTG